MKDNGGMGTFYRSRHELIFAFKLGDAPHIYERTRGGCARTYMISTLASGEGSRGNPKRVTG
jgi:hypothetical protein